MVSGGETAVHSNVGGLMPQGSASGDGRRLARVPHNIRITPLNHVLSPLSASGHSPLKRGLVSPGSSQACSDIDRLRLGVTEVLSPARSTTSSLSSCRTPTRPAQPSNVKVLLRVRPFTELEKARGAEANAITMEPNGDTLEVTQKKGSQSFPFDHILWSVKERCPPGVNVASQSDVFHKAGLPVLDAVLNGFNTCIFAYGQTGSGKTYTMMGEPHHPARRIQRPAARPEPLSLRGINDDSCSEGEGDDKHEAAKGLLPRIGEALFKTAQGFPEGKRAVFEVSFMEIYCERVKDLLDAPGVTALPLSRSVTASSLADSPPPSPADVSRTISSANLALTSMSSPPFISLGRESDFRSLKVRKHPVKGVFVEGIRKAVVENWPDCARLIEMGMKRRVTAATAMNETSSRSHALFTLTMTVTEKHMVSPGKHTSCHRTSSVHLVDLAGSERASRTGAKGQLLEEANQINLSLTVLRKVIDALVDQNKPGAIIPPVRESMLTWVLSDSLGGNSKTTMIATASPAADSLDETISTLRYAVKARNIVNTAKVNESSHARVVRELQTEIAKLREEQNVRNASTASLSEQIVMYEGALQEVKRLTHAMKQSHRRQLDEERQKAVQREEEVVQLSARLRAAEAALLNREETISELSQRDTELFVSEACQAMPAAPPMEASCKLCVVS